MKSKLQKIACSSILSLLLFSNYSSAQEAGSQIASMIQTGQFDSALSLIDNELKAKPKDPLLKFQRGIALSGLARNDEAIVEFSKLTEEYPQLPEPYNNLAVLYSAKGDLVKAKTSLEMAIKAQPNYLTAYDNLGDIYTKMASQYYEKASTLDPNNQSVKSKADLLHPITNLPIGSRQVYNSKSSMPFPSAPPSIVTSSDEIKPKKIRKEPKKEIKREAKTETKSEVKVEPKQETKPEATTTKATSAEQNEVINKVNSWAKSWSSKDVNGYLSHYSSSFNPDSGSKSDWEQSRKSKIQDKGSIDVQVLNPQVDIKGDTATVKFKQIYKSDKFKDTTSKTLQMIKVNGQWQIKQEKGN